MQLPDQVAHLLLTSMQTMLQGYGELKADVRANREAMITRTGDMMERFDTRIDDLAERFDQRIERAEEEIFSRFERTDHTISGHDGRLRAVEQRAAPQGEKATWSGAVAALVKVMPVRDLLVMTVALILALLGIMSPGEIKAIVINALGR